MTRDFENMLYIYGSALKGKNADAEHCVNLSSIRKLALSQNIWQMVYGAIRKNIEDDSVRIPQEIYASLETAFAANIAQNIRKVEFTNNTLKELENSGVKCCLYKGYSIARLYPFPEMRISSDTDILIDEKDERKAASILKKLGYEVDKRAEYNHHMTANHPVGGILETHISVMQKSWDDVIFYNKIKYSEEYIKMENGINTFGINDGLINVTTHFIKHFVRSGAGIRHLSDMLLYMKYFENEIDWERFNSLMSELKYQKLIDIVKQVGIKYWGMEFKDISTVDDTTIDEFLTDIEDGGIFGYSEEGRSSSYNTFVMKRKKITEEEFKKVSLNMEKTLFRRIFPEREYMKRTYPVGNNSIYMLPISHIKRYFTIVKNLATGKASVEQYIQKDINTNDTVSDRRVELMQNLEIIEKD